MPASSSFKKIIQKIDALQKNINAFRPLDESLNQTLQERLRIEWTYNSNAIEGNTLTFGETAFFLREGLTSEGKPLKDYLEAKNHVEAIDGLHEVIQNKRPLTESLIKELHAVLMKDMDFTYAKGANGQMIKKPLHPGKYKTRPNHVLTLSGKIHYYADPLKIKDEMEALVQWYNKNKFQHPLEKAALFHYRFVAIHPFDDGNGRLARILMNLILMKNGYPPCIIKNTHRRHYLNALEKVDQEKNFTPFILFIGQELIETLETIDKILKGETMEMISEQSTSWNASQREKIIIKTIGRKILSIGQIEEKIPQIKRPTLKNDLKRLVKIRKLKRKGKGKGVVYFRYDLLTPDPLPSAKNNEFALS